MTTESTIDPGSLRAGSEAPPIDEKPYKLIFEANRCIGAGHCASASENWELSIETGVADPQSFFIEEESLQSEVEAARACPANNGQGVIHVIDRRTGIEVAPNPDGDGSVSVDW